MNGLALLGLGGYGLAAIVFVGLALWQRRRGAGSAQRRAFVWALGLTACWCLACLFTGPVSALSGTLASVRNLGWLTYLYRLFAEGAEGRRRETALALYAVLIGASVAKILLGFAPLVGVPSDGAIGGGLFFVGLGLRIVTMAGGLMLVHNLYLATIRAERWRVRGPLVAIAVMWMWDLNLFTVTYLQGAWPMTLAWLRGPVMLALAIPFSMAEGKAGAGRIRLSRAAAFQSVSLLVIGCYLIFMVLATRAMALIGGENFRLGQVAVVMVMSVAAAILLPSPRVRAWLKVKIAKHFFAHRYDYREEWLRFTATLGRPGDQALPLERRVIKAIADIVESPGGILLVNDNAGGLTCGARWNWPVIDPPHGAAETGFVGHLEETGRVLELDMLRGEDPAEAGERALTPAWMLAEPSAWIAVPLIHLGRLTGVAVTERPAIDRPLDWEDFDLLKVAGRQAASYLAEAHSQEALSDAKRFDEFNRRFAFILHDIKNLVSQLSLVARNAERHADNPEFRADMVATLNSSVGKMNALLAMLSTKNRADTAEPRPLPLRPFVQEIARARRDPNPILVDGWENVVALADPARLEQAVVHLLQNAIDASPPEAPVRLIVGQAGGRATVAVEDRGRGMSAEFIRTGLFKPFNSTKATGFGVGAFEARSLVGQMGGTLEVESRPGHGSRFTVFLPLAPAAVAAA